MSRPSKPWYWKDRDAWYVNRSGKRILLCKGKANRKVAYRKFLELDDKDPEVSTERTTGDRVVALFLHHAQANLKTLTYEGYDRLLTPFGRHVRGVDGNAVQPRHINEYLDKKTTWGKTTRFNFITAAKRAWKWAKDEGYITLDPLASALRLEIAALPAGPSA